MRTPCVCVCVRAYIQIDPSVTGIRDSLTLFFFFFSFYRSPDDSSSHGHHDPNSCGKPPNLVEKLIHFYFKYS